MLTIGRYSRLQNRLRPFAKNYCEHRPPHLFLGLTPYLLVLLCILQYPSASVKGYLLYNTQQLHPLQLDSVKLCTVVCKLSFVPFCLKKFMSYFWS